MKNSCFPIFLLAMLYGCSLGAQTLLGEKQFGKYETDGFGEDVALSADGTVLAIGGFRNYDTVYHAGYVRVMEWRDEAWHQMGQDIERGNVQDGFGYKVALSADGLSLIAGAYDKPSLSVYTFANGDWAQIGPDLYIGGPVEPVTSVAISDDGSTVAFGIAHFPQAHIHRGVVSVYRLVGDSWMQAGADIEGKQDEIQAGWAIDLSADGSTLALSAIGDLYEELEGYIQVYTFEDGHWVEKGNAILPLHEKEYIGWSLSISDNGNRLGVGTFPFANEKSSFVSLYDFTNGIWQKVGQVIEGYVHVRLSGNGNRVAVARATHDYCPVIVLDLMDDKWVQMGNTIYAEYEYEWPGGAIAISKDGNRLASASIYQKGLAAVYDIGTIEPSNQPELCFSLDTIVKDKAIQIIPNPTSGLLKFSGAALIAESDWAEIQIYSILGQELHGYIVADNLMDISHLAAGMYLVRWNELVEQIIKVD